MLPRFRSFSVVRFSVSLESSAVKASAFSERTVRQTPLTAMLDPSTRSSIGFRARTWMVRKSRDWSSSRTSPTSSMIPVNICSYQKIRANGFDAHIGKIDCVGKPFRSRRLRLPAFRGRREFEAPRMPLSYQ